MQENLYFVRKHIWLKLVYIVTFALPCFHVAGYWECNNTNAHIDIHWFRRSHTLIQNTWQQTRQITIAINYFFYVYTSDKYLQFRKKSILIWAINFIIKSMDRKSKERDRKLLVKGFFSCSMIVINMKLLIILFTFILSYFYTFF